MKREGKPVRSLLGATPRMIPIVAPALAAAVMLRAFLPGFSAMAPRFRAMELALAVILASFGAAFWASATRRLLSAWRRQELATGGAFALTRHPIFSWWLWYEGGGSARRIIPELQDLAAGDSIAIVPAQVFTVLELVPARRLLVAGGLSRKPDGDYAPAPAREGFAVTWLFELLPTGPDACLLVSRFRTAFGGGLGIGLIFGVVNELGGAMLQQPAMFYGINERAAGPERKSDGR
jgi:protein-S-isoprenylcysteine O-methyltransferase Ste14